MPDILLKMKELMLAAAWRVSADARYFSRLNCPISRHLRMREKSMGMVHSR